MWRHFCFAGDDSEMRFWKAVYVCLVMAIATFAIAQSNDAAMPQSSGQQPKSPQQRPSPPGKAVCTFADGKVINVAYSRPYIRNRKIIGGLVPYGKVWRTGANEATSFETEAPLTVDGTSVPAGKYTLYTLPSEGTWKLIINKQTGQWGTQYDQSQDLARIDMKMQHLDTPVDPFTIAFEQTGTSCEMKLQWENTSASVNFQKATQTK